MNPTPEVSVVVPCYNEEAIIEKTYHDISAVLRRTSVRYELIFANDGSSDRTGELLLKISKADPAVIILDNPSNKGLATTYFTLYQAARGRYLVQLDADLSISPSIIPSLLAGLEHADVVIASRYVGIRADLPLTRLLASRAYNLLSRILFEQPVRDTQSGFVSFRKEILKDLVIESSRFVCHIEILVKLMKRGARVIEIPAHYVHRSQGSKFNLLWDGIPTLNGTLMLWWRLNRRTE